MGNYITATWGWDEHVQRGFHTRVFHPGLWQIITPGGADIGMLGVQHRPGQRPPLMTAPASSPGRSCRGGV
jgi:hypothetical protein